MAHSLCEVIRQLEALHDSRVLVYINDERPSAEKFIADEDVAPLYDALRSIGHVPVLDLVLHTGGGRVNVSRKIALLLRAFADQVHIMVPIKARSAGTLLCLSSNEIVMMPVAELGPIDSHTILAGDKHTAGPLAISAEDVRRFSEMAQAWFGVETPSNGARALELMNNRIFPTTLTAIYRADQQIRSIADELIAFQLPNIDQQARQTIVSQLVSGYDAHDYVITCAEAKRYGLKARLASVEEENLLWRLWNQCQQLMTRLADKQQGLCEQVDAVIATTTQSVVHIQQSVEYRPTTGSAHKLRMPIDAQWVPENILSPGAK